MSENRTVRHHPRWSRPIRGIAVAAFSALVLVGCGETPEQMLASAKSFLEKQDFDAAGIQLKNALQENANLAEARFLLGRVNLRQGTVAGAVKELERALELGYPRDAVAAELAPALVR
ncbi:MAG TPA: PEP-CTERM system TPR-repeat protein PrsT, partial [Thauera aminoaromatica]|nr:PEP-CTERM system TPR-repeat protein PrsT [Thauera aminoaromatica]